MRRILSVEWESLAGTQAYSPATSTHHLGSKGRSRKKRREARAVRSLFTSEGNVCIVSRRLDFILNIRKKVPLSFIKIAF